MPYIKPELRAKYENLLNQYKETMPETEGELNFLLSSMIKASWQASAMNYDSANALMGVLECVKQEFYRRTVTDYEVQKLNENGDI